MSADKDIAFQAPVEIKIAHELALRYPGAYIKPNGKGKNSAKDFELLRPLSTRRFAIGIVNLAALGLNGRDPRLDLIRHCIARSRSQSLELSSLTSLPENVQFPAKCQTLDLRSDLKQKLGL